MIDWINKHTNAVSLNVSFKNSLVWKKYTKLFINFYYLERLIDK